MKLIRIVYLLLIALLASCSMYASKTDRDAYQAYLQQPMRLPSDMYLVESKKWSALDMGRNWLFAMTPQPYYSNYVGTMIPSYGMYQANPQKWRRWQGDALSGWTRIDGVVTRGTLFHIEDIAPNGYSRKNYWVTIEIDEGLFQGRDALFMNPRSIIPRMYL